MKPHYDELEEIVALSTALVLSTRKRESDEMKRDFASLSKAIDDLHWRYPGQDWTVAIIDALARAEKREDAFTWWRRP